MQSMRFGPSNLLEYDAEYGVLICRECRYAIQKGAVGSHLLRHKIYRGERHRLLSIIAQLELHEPQDVRLPISTSAPISTLPVLPGFCCTAAGCRNLCASLKRMRRHWSEVHGSSEPSPHSARPAKLQTFFRGTKLRYFEVTLSVGTAEVSSPSMMEDDGPGRDRQDEQLDEADSVRPSFSQVEIPRLAPVQLDLDVLGYFHHFITTTSLTLPEPGPPELAIRYWQTNVVLQALRLPWLMRGVLAISACHLAILTDQPATQQIHRARVTVFSAWFFVEAEDFAHQHSCLGAEMKEVNEIRERITNLLRCAQGTLKGAETYRLPSTMAAIRRLASPESSTPSGHFRDDERLAAPFIQPSFSGEIASPSSASGSTSYKTPPALMHRLHTLPSRMAHVLSRPDDVQEALSSLAAISTLSKCCELSFAADEKEVAWQGMATWLNSVPDDFHRMVVQHHPAALVVVAHWAALLVLRAEQRGCWFLIGLAKAILAQVDEQLPVDDQAIKGLIAGLAD